MEKFSAPESEEVTHEQVIAAYKKCIDRGITHPDALDPDDPEAKEAHELFYRWQARENANAEGDAEAEKRANFAKTKLYIDAGFSDPDYLDEVLNWLVQDAADVEKQADNPDRARLRQDYAEEIKKIRNLLKQSRNE